MADRPRSFRDRLRAATGGVRVRTTFAAVTIVAIALVAAGIGIVYVTRDRLEDDVRIAAVARADDAVAALESGASPEDVVGQDPDDDVLIQVLDRDREVVASSPAIRGHPALTAAPSGDTEEISVAPEEAEEGTDEDREPYLAAVAGNPTTGATVVVARTLDVTDEAAAVLVRLLLIGIPLLLVVVGVSTWALVGRALRPVDAIRNEVDEISAAELHRRVPTPASRDEVARLAATMNRMLERLDRAHRRQQQFVSDASHELRSPVASIRELAEVALAHPERTSTSELAEHVLAEDLRVQRLVDDLLLLARADEQTLALRRRPVDLDDLVFAETRRLRAGTTAVRVETNAVHAARVVGDARVLRRVVANLGENAIRHAHEHVAFSLAETNGAVLLAVDDDGSGIPEAERERVFERFVRLDDARTRDAGGSGLGLAIVAQVVAAHGGSVRIVDGRLGGTRVEVVLASAS